MNLNDDENFGFLKMNNKTLQKYSHGIDIEKEILEAKIRK